MSVEKQNDPIDQQDLWRVQLDQMNTIPGQERLDKNRAWELLYDRLKKQPTHRKYSLYWIAAAGILGVAVFSGIKISHKEMHLVQKQKTNQASANLSLNSAHPSKPITGISANQEKTIQVRPSHREFIVRSRPGLPAMAQPEPGSKEIKSPSPTTLSDSSGALSYLPSLPVKRTFSVLPLNESADWSDPDELSAQKNGPHFFKLKVYNPGNLYLPTLAEGPAANSSIRIPLSTQN